MTKPNWNLATVSRTACAAFTMVMLFSSGVVGAEDAASAPAAGTAVEAPLILILERPNGAPIFTHEAKIRSYMVRIPAKSPEAVGALSFLAKPDQLKAGKVFLSSDDVDAALKTLAQATGRDVDRMNGPGVEVAAGNPAAVRIGPDWSYKTDWEKSADTADSWVAKGVTTRQVGQLAKVFPRMATDGSVQLSATFGLVDFDGFIEHSAPNERTTLLASFVAVNNPDAKVAERGVKKDATSAAPVCEPIFFSREVSVDVRIPEGKTLVVVAEGREEDGKKGDSLLVFVRVTTTPYPKRS